MEILVDPNVIYLLLAGGLALAVLALAAPGTGVLELLAFGILGLAAWGVVENQAIFNLWALILLVIGLGLFLFSVRRPNQIVLVLAILALIGGSAYIFTSGGWLPAVNPLLATLVSAALAVFFWFAAQKSVEAQRLQPAHQRTLVGEEGEAKTAIHKEGSAQIAGELWSAYSDEPIAKGAQVRVVKHNGFRLKVERM